MSFPAVAYGVGVGLNVVGGLLSSRSKRKEAHRRRQIADINAQQREAAGQAAGFEEERQAQLAASRALAVAGASGRSPATGSAARVIADVSAEGAYRAALQVYEAEEEARVMRLTGRMEAAALRSSAKGDLIGSGADLLAGAGSMYARYGGRGPGTDGID